MSTYGVAMVFADGEHPDSRRRPALGLSPTVMANF
jgi:hypothetical protein